MARIRSIHPSLCTDEAYMGMSLAAKAAWPLLWMECDDHGVFEWKPLVLKAGLFPADAIDMQSVLAEFEAIGCVMRVEIDGRPAGLIRNFCKYQRPKKPKYRWAITPEWETFIGLTNAGTEPVPNQSDPDGELPPQREEEGGKRNEEGKKKESIRPVASATRPDPFDDFWTAYPRRGGENPKKPAKAVFSAAVKSGVDPKTILAGAKAYAEQCRADRSIGTSYVAQALTWLRQARWDRDQPAEDEPVAYPVNPGKPQFDAWKAHFSVTGSKFMSNRMRVAEDEQKPVEMASEWPPDLRGTVSRVTTEAVSAALPDARRG